MRIRPWILIAAFMMSGCGGAKLAAVGLYTPVGPIGAEHCEKSNHCVIRTETGKTHMSIGKQSAVTIGFLGRGGDVEHYFDYLVTIRNISEKELFFDPKNIDGYDPSALLGEIRKREEQLMALGAMMGVSAGLGGSPNVAALQLLSAETSKERTVKQSQYAKQNLVAKAIPPGGEIGGRLIIKSSGRDSERIDVSIPIGPDFHSVSFARREQIPLAERRQNSNLSDISDKFSFDGRWLVIDKNIGGHTKMFICNLRTEKEKIFKECDEGGRFSGIVKGKAAIFESTPNSIGLKLIPVDQNTLEYVYPFGAGIFERQ